MNLSSDSPAPPPGAASVPDAELEAFCALCFWWVAPSVTLRELPREQLQRGLQTFSGHAGMRLAARLC